MPLWSSRTILLLVKNVKFLFEKTNSSPETSLCSRPMLPVTSITGIIRAVPRDTVNSWAAWLKCGIWEHFISNSYVGFPHVFWGLLCGNQESGLEKVQKHSYGCCSFFFLIFKAFKVIAAKYTANTAYGREGCDKKRHWSCTQCYGE